MGLEALLGGMSSSGGGVSKTEVSADIAAAVDNVTTGINGGTGKVEVKDNAISTAKLQDSAVTAAKLTVPTPYEPVWSYDTANVNIAAPGATIGGYGGLAPGNRVLLGGQTDQTQNGPWIWNGDAVAMTRPADFANGSTQRMGGTVFVISGSNSGTLVALNGPSDPVIGTDANYWTIAGPAPNSVFNGQVSPFAAISPSKLAGYPTDASKVLKGDGTWGTVGGSVGKFAAYVGDGAATTFTLAHGLGNADLVVELIEVATGDTIAQMITIDATNLTITFASAPTLNQYRVVAVG